MKHLSIGSTETPRTYPHDSIILLVKIEIIICLICVGQRRRPLEDCVAGCPGRIRAICESHQVIYLCGTGKGFQVRVVGGDHVERHLLL